MWKGSNEKVYAGIFLLLEERLLLKGGLQKHAELARRAAAGFTTG